MINDGTLTENEVNYLSGIAEVFEDETAVSKKLEDYPYTAQIRKSNPLFKKLIDPSILLNNNERILFIDSDVYFRQKVVFPQTLPEAVYCIDDVPGYSGSPLIPLRYPLVTGLNSGIMLYDPKIVDLNRVEYFSKKYFINSEVPWWNEQLCWALLLGKVADKALFQGPEVTILSDYKKRTIQDIQRNKTRYFNFRKRNYTPQDARMITMESVAIHFAGNGKKWINPEICFTKDEIAKLELTKAPNAHIFERLLLATRLLFLQLSNLKKSISKK